MSIRTLVVWLSVMLIGSPVAHAQQFEQSKRPFDALAKDLKIFVLQGDGAVNNIRSGAAVLPIVEVRDERNLPVPGADVVFELPPAGPSGYFGDKKLSWTGKTDENGQVVAGGFVPNEVPGRFGIRISATYGEFTERTVLAQTNSWRSVVKKDEPGGSGRTRLWLTIGLVGAAGAAGAFLWSTRGGTDRPTVVLQPGTISIGAPR